MCSFFIGKGIVAASLGRLLEESRSQGYDSEILSIYQYWSSGTMSPYRCHVKCLWQMMDWDGSGFGHYRFIDINLNKYPMSPLVKSIAKSYARSVRASIWERRSKSFHILQMLKDKIKWAARTTTRMWLSQRSVAQWATSSLFRSFAPDEGGCRSRQCHVYPYDPPAHLKAAGEMKTKPPLSILSKSYEVWGFSQYAGHPHRVASWQNIKTNWLTLWCGAGGGHWVARMWSTYQILLNSCRRKRWTKSSVTIWSWSGCRYDRVSAMVEKVDEPENSGPYCLVGVRRVARCLYFSCRSAQVAAGWHIDAEVKIDWIDANQVTAETPQSLKCGWDYRSGWLWSERTEGKVQHRYAWADKAWRWAFAWACS